MQLPVTVYVLPTPTCKSEMKMASSYKQKHASHVFKAHIKVPLLEKLISVFVVLGKGLFTTQIQILTAVFAM